MLIHKSNGVVFVAKDPTEKMDADELERLYKVYGEKNVLIRDYYVKKYAVVRNGKEQEIAIPYYSQSGALNRKEVRSQYKEAKNPLKGIQKTNAQARTKHMRTRAEIRFDRAGRKRS